MYDSHLKTLASYHGTAVRNCPWIYLKWICLEFPFIMY